VRVFVAVQPTPRSGASSLSRYIAQSKVDRDREQVDEKGSRPLFSGREDNLTYSQADRILNPTSGELEKEDVIHVVVSPERGSFERAGITDEERRQTFREAIRDAVHKMARELKVRFLNWIGGFHGNTRTPHGHLAVSRWAIDDKTGKLVYIKHLPESLLPRNLEGDDGTKRFSTGKIAQFFARSFNLKRKPVRFLQVQNLESDIEISRSVLSPYALMLREPTAQERVVGRWIEWELTLARALAEGAGGQEELSRECIELRGLVAEIDAGSRAQGARPVAGYVEPERLEELIRNNNSALRVKVFTERPEGERYLGATIGQPATREEKQTLAVPQGLKQGEVTAPMSTPQIISEPSPATTAQVKFNRQPKAEGARPGRAPSARAKTAQVGPAPGAKGVEVRDKVETPRVATKTLEELRSHTVLSRNPDAAIDKASEAPKAIKEHEGGTQQIGTKQGTQSVGSAIPIIPSARAERDLPDADRSAGNLATTKEPLRESRLTDKELGWLAHEVRFNRLYMERQRDISKDVIMRHVARIQASGDYDRTKTVAALEPLNSFELRLRDAILVDNIYEDARRKRNIPNQRLSDTEENLLKGRDSLAATMLKNGLAGEMALAKEKLFLVAPLVNPSRVQEYNRHQEDQRALAALDQGRENESTPFSDSEGLATETLERDPHSPIITPLQEKEAAASQALVENTIEHVL
jgi:hypothetical protein